MRKKAGTSIKTDWDLKLLYDSPRDPKLDKDVQAFKQHCSQFAKKYRESGFTRTPSSLKKALDAYSNLIEQLHDGRPVIYLHLYTSIDSSNTEVQALLSKYTQELSKAENELQFFNLEIGKISAEKQSLFLKSPLLKTYRYYLERRFLSARHDLTEKEENLLNLLSLPSTQLWKQGVEKVIGKLDVEHNGKRIPVTEAQELLSQLKTKERRVLHTKIMRSYESISDFAESEINAIITTKKMVYDLKKYPHPYSARILAAENEEKTILTLIDTVQKYNKLSHKFYRIKAKLLGERKLTYADRAADIATIKRTYSFAEACSILRTCLQSYDKRFVTYLDTYLQNGQIDVYPKKGKHGGAFQMNSVGNPLFILLNHTNSFDSVTTLAHEFGHAMHSEFSKSQPVIFQDYSLSTAETASTFFEQLVFDSLVKNMAGKEKMIALHNSVQDAISTVFRQVACFSFELDLHTQIKEKGALSKKEIGALHNVHMKNYLGALFSFSPLDGNYFIQWSHIRNPFYVYTYAFGHLVSLSLFALVKEAPENMLKVIEFLSAGSSDTPENIFKKIGIDITTPSFFEKGLQKISQDIDELERLVQGS